jgi:hypothetical protein
MSTASIKPTTSTSSLGISAHRHVVERYAAVARWTVGLIWLVLAVRAFLVAQGNEGHWAVVMGFGITLVPLICIVSGIVTVVGWIAIRSYPYRSMLPRKELVSSQIDEINEALFSWPPILAWALAWLVADFGGALVSSYFVIDHSMRFWIVRSVAFVFGFVLLLLGLDIAFAFVGEIPFQAICRMRGIRREERIAWATGGQRSAAW